ncbi:unnamed protein product [Amoebophrya sp. A120]|nr:unnamed protein product [Amoebophrya sp. A120]|eukprot:GSA120T00019481001.1
MRRTLLSLGVLAAPVLAKKKHAEIDAMKHDIQEVYARNFDAVIGTSLPLTVSSVLYFKSSNKGDAAFLEKYNEVAKKTKKMLKIAAMDCDEAAKHCERVGVKETPHLQLYPVTPRPHFKYEGEMEAEAILKQLYKLIPGDKVTPLTTAEEFGTFKRKNPTKPKIVLFSDKKKAPTILKGLSTDSVFTRTVEFGFVFATEADAVMNEAGAKKKKLPAVMLIAKGKQQWYKEKDLSFSALHEWINVNSESGMGDTVKGVDGASEVEAEEVEYEKVRELHSKSAQELCYKQTNVCAIFLQEGPKLDDKVADMINSFESKFAPKNDRGVKYNWMWMDITQEPEFKKTLDEQEKKVAKKEDRDEEPFQYPTMIFVKPPKKKREEKLLTYIRLTSDAKVNSDSVSGMVERIASGATYTRADLPKFAVRAKKAAGKKDEL